MNRPPFLRNKSAKHHPNRKPRNTSAAQGKKGSKSLRALLLVAVIVSVWQFATTGDVGWLRNLWQQVARQMQEFPGQPGSGWRETAETLEKIGAAREGQTPPKFDFEGRIVRVADGDTVSVLDSNKKQHKVRLFGIDSPERDQPHGSAAGRSLAKRIMQKNVGVVIVEKDSYGRTVGMVYHDGENMNQWQVAQGNAWWYRYHAPHERHLQHAEASAREAGLGLWSENKPIAPWDWRRGRR